MIVVYWFRSLVRTATGRMALTAGGIALAVALSAVLGAFVISAAETMTAQAIANVPVDWQVEMAPGANRAVVENALAGAAAPETTRAVDYANVVLRRANVRGVFKSNPRVCCLKEHAEHFAPESKRLNALIEFDFSLIYHLFIFHIALFERISIKVVQIGNIARAK